MDSGKELINKGIMITILGFVLIFSGILLTLFIDADVNTEFGGLIMIGPIPIIVGTSTEMAFTMAVLAIVIIIAYLFMWRKAR